MSEGPNDTFFPTEREEATEWLNSLLNKNLRVSVTDGRMFWGQFKCVDAESNIILHSTYEYRFPTSSQLAAAAAAVTSSLAPSSSTITSSTVTSSTITSSSALSAPSDPSNPSLDPPLPSISAPSSLSTAQEDLEEAYDRATASGKIKVDLSSRYLGLVVIPGEYITKIELEEFASQIRGRNKQGLGMGLGSGSGFHTGWRDAAGGGRDVAGGIS